MPPRAVLLLALLLPLSGGEVPNALVLMSYHRGQPWEDGIAAGLQEALAGHAEAVFIHFDHKRFPQPAAADLRVAVAEDALRRARPRLIIAVDDHAFAVVNTHRARLGADLPLVFCGLNHWSPEMLPPRATGVAERFDPAGTLALAFALHPGVQRLVVLNDDTDTGRANRRTLDEALPGAAGGRSVRHIGLGTWAETEAELAACDPQRDLVLMLTWNLDASGATQGHEDSVARARRACPAPIYGVWDFQFGFGIVGGSLFDSRVHGREAGELAVRVLAGEAAETIPVRTQPRTRTVVDVRELERHGVAAAAVPAGVELVGMEPSFWRQHARKLALIAAVIAAQAATIAGLLVAMARRRRAEAARREAETRLRQASRMDAVGQLAAGVAHDFNNVLTAILGHADLLALRLEAGSPLRGHVDTIAGSAQRAAGTVRNLLVFARGRGGGGTAACEVNRLVEEVVALLAGAIDRRIAIETCLDPAAGAAGIGADELQQVLINLALNARDAMPDGGRLRLATARVALDGGPGGPGLPPGGYVRISVRDTGRGIAAEHRERIFDPFFTTKPPGQGTGLGLAVVHGAVRAARGAIRVESRPGEGAEFHLWLPVAATPTPRGVPLLTAPSDAGVLLVDDEAVVLEVVGELLAACGATVHRFADPTVAATWFALHADEVSLALLDGNMPGMTGWQLAVRLREARPELRIVALTGAATAPAIDAWHAAGVEEILTKPVTRAQLQAVVARPPTPA